MEINRRTIRSIARQANDTKRKLINQTFFLLGQHWFDQEEIIGCDRTGDDVVSLEIQYVVC